LALGFGHELPQESVARDGLSFVDDHARNTRRMGAPQVQNFRAQPSQVIRERVHALFGGEPAHHRFKVGPGLKHLGELRRMHIKTLDVGEIVPNLLDSLPSNQPTVVLHRKTSQKDLIIQL
jgi:hypothetical protein